MRASSHSDDKKTSQSYSKEEFIIQDEKMRYIYKIMEKINSSNDINIVGRDIVDIMTNALDCIGGALFIVDEENGVIRPFAYSRISAFIERVIPLLPKPFEEHVFDIDLHDNYTIQTFKEKKVFIGNKYEDFMYPVLPKLLTRAIQRAIGMKTIVSSPTIAMGKVVGVFQIAFKEKEISERKKNLMKFFSDQCAIAIKNAQEYQKLQTQNKEMQEILDQQSDFIATSSHELRTPVSAALFQAQDLAESLEKVTNYDLSEQQEEATMILESLERLQAITEKIFAVQAYDAQKIKLYFVPVNLDDFCSVIYYKFKPRMKKNALKWTVEKDLPKKFVFNFDSEQIEKMLNEIILNAINFSPKNGEVKLRIYMKDVKLCFEVTDTGKGIPGDQREHIFKKFKTNHTMQSMGIGLGLYVVKKIVELHHGEISVHDALRGGARFVVELPNQEIN